MGFKPLHDRVLVRRVEAEEKTAGGIIIPDSAKEKPIKGEILAVGPGKVADDGKRVEMTVKVGDKVAGARTVVGKLLDRRAVRPSEDASALEEPSVAG